MRNGRQTQNQNRINTGVGDGTVVKAKQAGYISSIDDLDKGPGEDSHQ